MEQKTAFVLLLVLSVAIGFVHCQSEDEEGGTGLWSRLKKMVKDFVDSMKGIWGEMRKEIENRTVDMRSWTKEMYESFKLKMKEWVDQVGGASSSEREGMRNYIERLEMPKQEQKK